MDFSNAPADLLVNIVAGILGAVIILIVLEKRKSPYLRLNVGETHSVPDFTLLRVSVHNQGIGRLLSKIYDRDPALMCYAWINFYYDTDKAEPVRPGQELVGRWSFTPVPVREVSDGKRIYDGYLTRDSFDIAPGTSTLLDIVCKFNHENDCFGWNNESYTYPEWRNTNWQLNRDRYIVRVKIMTGGKETKQLFRLINELYPGLEKFDDEKLLKKLQ